MTIKIKTPDQQPALNDPGDETARRYRYQWTYSAILCCMLLDETFDIEEIYCEHHEDVLLKKSNGKFIGIQVKTRDTNQTTWRVTDSAFIKSCVQFSKLETDFPEVFEKYSFATNHISLKTGSYKDINKMLSIIKEMGTIDDLPKQVNSYLNKISEKAECQPNIVFKALKKTVLDESLPKITDITNKLISHIVSVWDRANDCTHTALKKTANHLINHCANAASLKHEETIPMYLAYHNNPEQLANNSQINGKRITSDHLLEILNEGLNKNSDLKGDPQFLIKPGSGDKNVLIEKLEVGGFSAISCNSAEDLRDKAEYLGMVWINKYGENEGLQRYSHVRSLMLKDAAQAFEESKNDKSKFGLKMLEQFYEKVSQRRERNSQLYDCTDEHLEGLAYSLTSECKVRWSHENPWSDKE